jgi:NAD(P)-dependent dehydrogenase (short-subunit alcohol dehydrogenase family)
MPRHGDVPFVLGRAAMIGGDDVVLVTGAAGGLGAAMARRLASSRPRGICLVDLDADRLDALAKEVAEFTFVRTEVVDVTDESALLRAIDSTRSQWGPVTTLCQFAGVLRTGGIDAPDSAWELCWSTNVMSQLYGARAVLPAMVDAGRGNIINMCSAAGLQTDPAAAPYAVSKHATVALTEWLAINYRGAGVRVMAVCPQGVDTPMLDAYFAEFGEPARALAGEVLPPGAVVDAVIHAWAEGRFLVLPHAGTADGEILRATDRERWFDSIPRVG